MRDERPRVILFLLFAYALSVASLIVALRVALGLEFSLEWARWYWTVATRTGFQTNQEITIFAATFGGLAVAFVFPVYAASFLPWRIDAYGGCKSAWARWGDLAWLRWRYSITVSRRLKEGLILGMDEARRWLVCRAPLFVLVFGPAGEGKTAGVLIPTALNLPTRTAIINDPAGELYDATAGHRAKLGRVIRLEWGSPASDGFNPLARDNMPADPQAICDQIDTLAAILIPAGKSGNESSAFFTNSARSSLSTAIMYHFFGQRSEDKDTSVGAVLSWLSMLGHREDHEYDPDEADPVGTDLRNAVATARQLGMPSRVVEAMNSFATINAKTRSDIIATIRDDKLLLWRNDYVRAATDRSSFSLAELDDPTKSPATVYLVVPVADQERYGKATGLFIEALYTHITRGSPKRPRRPIALILDELKFIPPLRAVKDGPSILRKFKVSGIFGFQDRAQVSDVYDDATLSGFDQNCIAKCIFTLGHLDTAKWVSDTIGNRWSVKRVTQGSSIQPTNIAGSSQASQSTEAVPLMTTQDVMGMEAGRHLVLIRSKPHRPVYARSPLFFRTKPFKAMAAMKPPIRATTTAGTPPSLAA